MACGKGNAFEVGPVTPTEASTFYASVLPKAGYTVTMNTLASDPHTGAPNGVATLMFTGHGHAGLIIAAADLSSVASGPPSAGSMSGSLTKNFLEITIAPGSNPGNLPAC